MLDVISWKIAWRSLYNQGIRVVLSGLAIASATALLILLMTISDWTTASMREDIEQHEKSALLVFNSYNYQKNGTDKAITLQKMYSIHEKSPVKASWTGHFTQYHRARVHDKRISLNQIHSTDRFTEIYSLELDKGRSFTQWDNAERHFCIVGQHIAHLLAQEYGENNPWFITLNQKRYQVIGSLQTQSNKHLILHNINNSVITLINHAESLTKHLDEITFGIHGNEHEVETIKKHMQKNFSKRQFQITDTGEMVQSMRSMIRNIESSLLAIGIVSLVLSSFNIVNSMLASIYERREEIGIRLAIGAQPYHIRNLFLQEISLMCCISALLGILVSHVGLYLTAHVMEWTLPYNILHTFTAFISCICIGLIAGIYPTQRAKNIKPIEVIYGH